MVSSARVLCSGGGASLKILLAKKRPRALVSSAVRPVTNLFWVLYFKPPPFVWRTARTWSTTFRNQRPRPLRWPQPASAASGHPNLLPARCPRACRPPIARSNSLASALTSFLACLIASSTRPGAAYSLSAPGQFHPLLLLGEGLTQFVLLLLRQVGRDDLEVILL